MDSDYVAASTRDPNVQQVKVVKYLCELCKRRAQNCA